MLYCPLFLILSSSILITILIKTSPLHDADCKNNIRLLSAFWKTFCLKVFATAGGRFHGYLFVSSYHSYGAEVHFTVKGEVCFQYREGRIKEDFNAFMAENPGLPVTEYGYCRRAEEWIEMLERYINSLKATDNQISEFSQEIRIQPCVTIPQTRNSILKCVT